MAAAKCNWEEMWIADKESVMATMQSNMQADLDAGYNPYGKSIVRQKLAMLKYKEEFEKQLMQFADWTDEKTQRWCYYDLKRRGAIS